MKTITISDERYAKLVAFTEWQSKNLSTNPSKPLSLAPVDIVNQWIDTAVVGGGGWVHPSNTTVKT